MAPEVEATGAVAEDDDETVVDVTAGESGEDGAAGTVFTIAALAGVVTAAEGGLAVTTVDIAVPVPVAGALAVMEVSYRGLMIPPT